MKRRIWGERLFTDSNSTWVPVKGHARSTFGIDEIPRTLVMVKSIELFHSRSRRGVENAEPRWRKAITTMSLGSEVHNSIDFLNRWRTSTNKCIGNHAGITSSIITHRTRAWSVISPWKSKGPWGTYKMMTTMGDDETIENKIYVNDFKVIAVHDMLEIF